MRRDHPSCVPALTYTIPAWLRLPLLWRAFLMVLQVVVTDSYAESALIRFRQELYVTTW